MKYRVEITETAWAEVEEAYQWFAGQSLRAAMLWKKTLLQTVDSLEMMPDRCHLAPESRTWKREIRELLHGKRRGVFRILFEIRGDMVYVLRVRHGARRLLTDE
jgi:plasmid stabilization system protein ParE